MRNFATKLVVLAALLATYGCGAAEAGRSGGGDDYAYRGGGGTGEWEHDAALSSSDSSDASYDIPEPEEEIAYDFKAPQASEHYVYIAATARDSLVRIDAETLEIRLIPVGGRPTRVATLPVGDVALVINSGTQDFSVVSSTTAADDVRTVEMLPYVNTIAVAPSGKYAIVYYNDQNAAPDEPVGDFQTVAVISLAIEGEVDVDYVSTGFHPTAVYFHATDAVAYLVTDDGISVLDLKDVKNGDITPIVGVSKDGMDDPDLREVLVTPDGQYAVVRNLASPEIAVVDLVTGVLSAQALDGLPTDLDLIPGKDRILVMLREQSLAYVVDLGDLVTVPGEGEELPEAAVPIDIAGTSAGAAVVTSDGKTAVLYTTIGGVRSVAVLSLTHEPYKWKHYPVQKGVVGVAASLKGTTALVLHQAEAALDATTLEKTIAASEGFTLFNLESGYRKLIQAEHRWSDYLFVTDDKDHDLKAYILTPDTYGLSHQVLSVDLGTYIVEKLPLASWPESMVFVPASRKVAIAQEHENGRLTFVDVDTDETWSVTGYELNGLID